MPAAKPRSRPASRKVAPKRAPPVASTLAAELAQGREQQQATSEILRLIARSPNDAQPVFDARVTHAPRLCEAHFAFLMRHEDGRLLLMARTPCTPEFAAYLERGFAIDATTTSGRAAGERRLARLMGGDLHVESTIGAGSTFTLTLPLRYRAERP